MKGIYECCAINRAGIGRAVIHLTVKEMEYFRSVVNDRIVSVDELKDAYLSVDVTSDKLKVKWYWDGDEVDYNNQRFQLIESGCKRILKVACKIIIRLINRKRKVVICVIYQMYCFSCSIYIILLSLPYSLAVHHLAF